MKEGKEIIDSFTNLEIPSWKKWRLRHPEYNMPEDKRSYSERQNYFKQRYFDHREECLQYVKKSNLKVKMEVFSHYCNGNIKCQCPGCNESNPKFLTLDHTNNNGKEDRKRFNNNTSRLLRFLRRNGYPEGYQVLCYNCNQGKDKNGGICPHLGGAELI